MTLPEIVLVFHVQFELTLDAASRALPSMEEKDGVPSISQAFYHTTTLAAPAPAVFSFDSLLYCISPKSVFCAAW